MEEEKKSPTISIIIPTYNRAHLIHRAINSVLNQTYQDFEIIIVDDGSTDNTEEAVRSFNDSRIEYIRHEKNQGAAVARNTGIKAAKGEYIAFQDSDDEWFPQKLEKQMKVFETASPEVGVVYTGFWCMANNKKRYVPSKSVKQKEGNIFKELLKGSFITTQSIVVRKKCFESAGLFDENLPRFQDWELALRLSKHSEFKCVDEPLLISYHTTGSISRDLKALIKASEIIMTKHFEDFSKDRKLLARYLFGFGISLCLDGQYEKGRHYIFRAVKLNPLHVKFVSVAFLSFLGRNAFSLLIRLWKFIEKQIP